MIDARGADALEAAARRAGRAPTDGASPSPATSPTPPTARQLVDAAAALGGLDLLVNNASILGPSPQPELADYPLDVLRARVRGQRPGARSR